MVYKLVARQDAAEAGSQWPRPRPTRVQGRKAAFRTLSRGTATSELIAVSDGSSRSDGGGSSRARALQVALVERRARPRIRGAGVARAREHHAIVREELPVTGLALSRSDPALPVYIDA
jgi:nicotinate phosphoribosyltransferase